MGSLPLVANVGNNSLVETLDVCGQENGAENIK